MRTSAIRRSVIGISLAMTAIGGLALAAWTSSGSGIGTSTTAATAPVVLSPSVPIAGLYPGGRGDLAVTITNPNTMAVVVEFLGLDVTSGDGGFSVDDGHPACSTTALTLSPQTNGGAGWTVPSRTGGVDGTAAIVLADAVVMDASAANACQGATFTVYLESRQ